jgi:hypothetical protein
MHHSHAVMLCTNNKQDDISAVNSQHRAYTWTAHVLIYCIQYQHTMHTIFSELCTLESRRRALGTVLCNVVQTYVTNCINVCMYVYISTCSILTLPSLLAHASISPSSCGAHDILLTLLSCSLCACTNVHTPIGASLFFTIRDIK